MGQRRSDATLTTPAAELTIRPYCYIISFNIEKIWEIRGPSVGGVLVRKPVVDAAL